jgi:hypothetical protein
VFDVQLKEEFIVEPVVAFDDVLIEAVERVVASAGTSTETTVSKVSSTSSSRSTSKRRERERETGRRDSVSASSVTVSVSADARCPGTSSTQGLLPVLGTGGSTTPQEVPRSQCKTVLLGALEDIIHDVIGEREQELEGSTGNRKRESPLREAVRGWIENVESGGGGD